MLMRAVKSRAFLEQMKDRGVRVFTADDLPSVTPDAKAKADRRLSIVHEAELEVDAVLKRVSRWAW